MGETPPRCRKCGKLIPAGSMFCMHCGAEQGATRRRRASRRPMNSGSIRKLSGNRTRPYAAYLPRSAGGGFVGSYETRAQAADALALELSTRPSSERIVWTVEDFYNYYINSPVFAKLTKSAQNTAYAAWKYCDSIRAVPMREAKTHAWQTCVDSAISQGRSRSTCEKIRNLASQLCKEAMKDDVINKNYASLVSVSDGAGKKAKDILTEQEIALLRSHDDDMRVRFILILVYTGMRISELLELPCENVHDKYIIGGKKTTAGKNRIIPILPQILSYIVSFDRGEGLLIHNAGRPLTVKYARSRWFYDCLVDYGILSADEIPPHGEPRLTPHCTRHTFATLARQAGIKPDVLTRIIGHTDYSMTDEVYIDMQADFLMEEMQKMSKSV